MSARFSSHLTKATIPSAAAAVWRINLYLRSTVDYSRATWRRTQWKKERRTTKTGRWFFNVLAQLFNFHQSPFISRLLHFLLLKSNHQSQPRSTWTSPNSICIAVLLSILQAAVTSMQTPPNDIQVHPWVFRQMINCSSNDSSMKFSLYFTRLPHSNHHHLITSVWKLSWSCSSKGDSWVPPLSIWNYHSSCGHCLAGESTTLFEGGTSYTFSLSSSDFPLCFTHRRSSIAVKTVLHSYYKLPSLAFSRNSC